MLHNIRKAHCLVFGAPLNDTLHTFLEYSEPKRPSLRFPGRGHLVNGLGTTLEATAARANDTYTSALG